MGLDPNDLRLTISAEVSAPGAQEAAAQIRAAGQAADETRSRFDRLRESGAAPRSAEPVLPAFSYPAPPAPSAVAATLPRVTVQPPSAPTPAATFDASAVRAAEQAHRGLNRTIDEGALAMARAGGITDNYARTIRTVGEALLNRGSAQTEAEALRRAAVGVGVSQARAEKFFPDQPGDVQGDRAPEPGRVRAGISARATQEAEQTRRSAEGLEEPIRRAERSAGGLASQLGLSGQGIGRAALALTGFGVGLSAATTIAGRLHEEIANTARAQEDLVRGARETAATYGRQSGAQIQAQAAAFTADPTTRGNEQDYLGAANALHGLSVEYGLNTEQVRELTTAAGQLALIHNTELAPAVQAIEGVLRGNVDAAQRYGVALTDEQGRIRGVGVTYEQLVGIVGRARAEHILYGAVLQSVATQQVNAAAPVGSTVSALDQLEKASTRARESLTHLAEKPFNIAVNYLTKVVEAAPQAASAALEIVKATPPGRVIGAVEQAAQGVQQIGQAVGNVVDTASRVDFSGRYPQIRPPTPAVGDGTASMVAAAAAAQAELGDTAKGTTDTLRSQLSVFEQIRAKIAGDLIPALERLATTQQTISGLGTIEQALRGPDALTGGDIQRRAAAQAAQDVLAQQRQRDAQQYNPLVDQARELNPLEFDRRQAAHAAELEARRAQTFAGRAQAEAQGQVTAIDLTDRQRELDAAGDLARLRTETLGREGGIVDLQRQEADLADRQRVAARENLDLLEQQTRARLDSLQAANQLNDLQYQDRRDVTEIRAIRADVRRGVLDPSALQQIPELRQQIRAERLATPRAELNALEAGRPAELAGRAVERDQLQNALRGIPLQREQRGLEDQLTPLQQAQRLTEERTQELNRQLELARLAEEPQRTAAERNVLAATAVSLAADISARRAEEWAANINNGLTAIERAWVILGQIPQAPPPIGPPPTPQPAQPFTGVPFASSQAVQSLVTGAAANGGAQAPQIEAPAYQRFPVTARPAPGSADANTALIDYAYFPDPNADVYTVDPNARIFQGSRTVAPAARLPEGQLQPTAPIVVPADQGGVGAVQSGAPAPVENQTINITINVATGAGAGATEIANLAAQTVVEALNRRAVRAPRATPRTMVGAR